MRSERRRRARFARRTWLLLALAPLGWVTKASADAEPEPPGPEAVERSRWGSGWNDRTLHRRPGQLAVMTVLYGSFTDVVAGPRHNVFGPGLGFRGTFPLLHDGFLSDHNDALDVELGSDAYAGIPDRYHTRSFVGVVPDLAVRWTFYTGRGTAVYVKAGAQVDVGIDRSWWPVFVWPSGAVGALLVVSRSVDVKLELGWPGVRAGFAFDL